MDEVYAVGGAKAIAMFTYGAKGFEPQDGEILCDPVDKITQPGNIFVATAKRMVSGIVGIDAVAASDPKSPSSPTRVPTQARSPPI